MLPAAYRLVDAESFRLVQRRGRRCAARRLVTHVVATDAHGAPPRVGLVVAKSVGDAVTRNRVKRRLRHLARERLGDLPGGSLWVVRALPAAAVATSADLGSDLDRCLHRSGAPSERDGSTVTSA